MFSFHRNAKAPSSVAPTPKQAPEKPKKPQIQRSNSPPRNPPSQPLRMKPALEQSVPAPAAPHAQPTLSSQAHSNVHLAQPNNAGPMFTKPALAPHFAQHPPPDGAGGTGGGGDGGGGGATGGGPPEFSV